MKLKKVIFYQSVRLWDNQEYHTVNVGHNKDLKDVDIVLIDHLVHLHIPGLETIVVPTANMRMGIQLGIFQGANPDYVIEPDRPFFMEKSEEIAPHPMENLPAKKKGKKK